MDSALKKPKTWYGVDCMLRVAMYISVFGDYGIMSYGCVKVDIALFTGFLQ